MIRDSFKEISTETKHKLFNQINIASKMLYIIVNNHCIKKGCSNCGFYVDNSCTLKDSPEEWQYKSKCLRYCDYYLHYGYDTDDGTVDASLPKIINYMSALSLICHANLYNCEDCKFQGDFDKPSWCTISYVTEKILKFKR